MLHEQGGRPWGGGGEFLYFKIGSFKDSFLGNLSDFLLSRSALISFSSQPQLTFLELISVNGSTKASVKSVAMEDGIIFFLYSF